MKSIKVNGNCPHCEEGSFALKHPLKETENFRVVCDVHPLVQGHILIIPKEHLSCVGAFSDVLFGEFIELYWEISKFVKLEYDAVASFEHGKIGQTVLHAHVHLLPFSGEPTDVVPEGERWLRTIESLESLRGEYKKDGRYLFFSIEEQMWLVDAKLGAPRFFRDRFANVLGRPERGNWKKMRSDEKVMQQAKQDIAALEKKWKSYNNEVK